MSNRMFRVMMAAAVASGAMVIAGCSDDDDPVAPPAPQTKMTATVHAGAVVGATCTVAPSTGGASLPGSFSTNASGQVDIVPAPTVPVIVTCTGGSYFDEASGTSKPVPAGQSVRAAIPAGSTSVAVTPLTSIAVALLETLPPEQRTATALDNANQKVASALVPGLNILTPPTPITSNSTVLGTSPGDLLALALAGLAKAAAASGVDPFQLAGAISTGAVQNNGRIGAGGGSLFSSLADLGSKIDSGAREYAQETQSSETQAALNGYQETNSDDRDGSGGGLTGGS